MDTRKYTPSKVHTMSTDTVPEETDHVLLGEGTALDAVISFMTVIIVLGVAGNILVIIAIVQNKKLQTVSNIFVANLSICDLMFVTVVLPVNMYTYVGESWQFTEAICKFIGFLSYTLTGTTIMTITLIAWNRYKFIIDIHCYKSLFRPRNMTLMLVATWIVPIIGLQPAVFGTWGHFSYNHMLSSCNLGVDNSSQSFKIFLLIVRAAIPCALIIYFYSAIYTATRASHKRLYLIPNVSINLKEHNHRREMRLTKMMIGIFVVFSLSYFPCTVSSVVDWRHLLSKTFHMFCQTSVFLGSTINPLLYGFMNKQFRSAYYKILTCSAMFHWCRHERINRPNKNKTSKDNENYNGKSERPSGEVNQIFRESGMPSLLPVDELNKLPAVLNLCHSETKNQNSASSL